MTNKLCALCTLWLLTAIIHSCDVPGLLLLKNRTDKPAEVRYQAKESHDEYVRNFILNGPPDSVSIKMFGFGYWWTDSTIKSYSKDIDTFKISNSEGIYVITDSLNLSEYMRSARSKGLFKASWGIKSPLKEKHKKYFKRISTSN